MKQTIMFALVVAVVGGACIDDELGPAEKIVDVAATPVGELDPEAEPWALEAAVAGCPGMEVTGIESYDGLPGYYSRALPYVDGELVTLQVVSVEQIDGWIGVEGDYNALVVRGGLFSFEGGRYVAVPNNPAIGPAIGFDGDGDEAVDELYFVLAAERNLLGRIAKLCLGKSRPDGSGSAFLMTRLGW